MSEVVIGELISATKTEKGLTVTCVLDERVYETGKKVSDEAFKKINIRKNKFHSDYHHLCSQAQRDILTNIQK